MTNPQAPHMDIFYKQEVRVSGDLLARGAKVPVPHPQGGWTPWGPRPSVLPLGVGFPFLGSRLGVAGVPWCPSPPSPPPPSPPPLGAWTPWGPRPSVLPQGKGDPPLDAPLWALWGTYPPPACQGAWAWVPLGLGWPPGGHPAVSGEPRWVRPRLVWGEPLVVPAPLARVRPPWLGRSHCTATGGPKAPPMGDNQVMETMLTWTPMTLMTLACGQVACWLYRPEQTQAW